MMKSFSVKLIALMFCMSLFLFVGCTQKAAVKDEAAGEQKVAAQAEKKDEVKADSTAASDAYELTNLYFDFDKAVIKDEGKALLNKHAEWLKANNAVKIVVEGHCDERGTAEYNLALGQRRAAAAAKYLVSMGVAKKRIKTVSFGKEKPLDPGHNEDAWAKNRRDQFVIK